MQDHLINVSHQALIQLLSDEDLPLHCNGQTLRSLIQHDLPQSVLQKIQYALELARRYYAEPLRQRPVLSSSQATQTFLIAALRDYDNEVLACLFLDTHNRMIEFEVLFEGSINKSEVYPRTLVKRALYHNAAHIILAHNHPSGCLQPSKADFCLTRRLQGIMRALDMSVLDHIVVAGHQAQSIWTEKEGGKRACV